MAPKTVLSLDQIRQAADVEPSVDVEVPEWGGVVKVRGLKRGVVVKINLLDDEEEANALALAEGLVDPAVTLDEARELLAEKGSKPINRLVEAILEASGIRPGFRAGAAD